MNAAANDDFHTDTGNISNRRKVPGVEPLYGYDLLYNSVDDKPFHQIRWNEDGTRDVLDPATLAVIATLDRHASYIKTKNLRPKLVPSSRYERVEAVQLIFGLSKSMGCKGICTHMNNLGVPAPQGRKWTPRMIRDMLLNQVYHGTIVFGRIGKIQKNHPVKSGFGQEQFIVLHDSHEALAAL